MKSLLYFFFVFISFSAFSQDIIELKDGETIEAKIVEITETTLKYNRASQPDGPLRHLSLTRIKKVTYEDGTIERFVTVVESKPERSAPREEKPKYEKRRGPDRIPIDKDRVLEQGLFVDFLIGYASDEDYNPPRGYFSIGARVGHKWYFGKGEKYRPGIQATWVRIGLFTDEVDDIATGIVAPLGLGFANAFKFGEKAGLEVNLGVSPLILDFPPDGFSDLGVMYGMDVKYRYGRLAVGIDFSRADRGYNKEMTMLGLTAGLKF